MSITNKELELILQLRKDLDIYPAFKEVYMCEYETQMTDYGAMLYGAKLLHPVIKIPKETIPNLLNLKRRKNEV